MSNHPGYKNSIKCRGLKKRDKDHIFSPAPHQQKVVDYFLESPYKGLLLYHKLGSGKSCTSILVADTMLAMGRVKRVFVLTPGSLRKNWVSEYCRVCGDLDRRLFDKYVFITYNYNIHENLDQYKFKNSLVIIDECHNLINSYKNGSKNAVAIYDKIMATNCRVLALSGTPIIQDNPMIDWKLLSTILDGGRSNEISDVKDIPTLHLQGIVSYFPGDPSSYPEVRVKPIQRTPMTLAQYKEYKRVYDREQKIRVAGPPDRRMFHTNRKEYEFKMREFIKATKYLLSRMVSNFYYDEIDTSSLPRKSKPIVKVKVKVKEGDPFDEEDIKDAEIIDSIRDYPDLPVKEGGWLSSKMLENKGLSKMSPKFTALLLRIIENINSKHVIYSFYKSRSGVQLLHTLLTHCGITAEIYSGDVDMKKRENILNRFNEVDNRKGKKLKVLLVTDAGAEGITVLECNNIHILESNTKENKTRQAIGRVIRYKSHQKLPEDERYVNVWRYWSVAPEGDESERLVDEILYRKGLETEKKTDKFIRRIIDNSIEKEE
jgi:superfamily II DNA or RNA helicase